MTEDTKDVDQEAKKPKVKLVKMIRESDGATADVHPDEVENFMKGDFKAL